MFASDSQSGDGGGSAATTGASPPGRCGLGCGTGKVLPAAASDSLLAAAASSQRARTFCK